MIETLQEQSFAYRQRWGEAAEPVALVERSRTLTETLRVRDIIIDRVDSAREIVRDRLEAIIADHQQRGMVRTGATLKAGVGLFEEQTILLIEGLFEAVAREAGNAETFGLVKEGVERFLSFLDGELGRIIERIEFEVQDRSVSNRFAQAARRFWSEEKARLLGRVEHHRIAGPSACAVPDADVAPQGMAQEPDKDPEVACADGPAQESQPGADDACDSESISGNPEAEGDLASPPQKGEADSAPPMSEQEIDAKEAEDMAAEKQLHEMWADVAMRLWTGRLQVRSKADLCDAMRQCLTDMGGEGREAEVQDCARLLWRKFLISNRVISDIGRSLEEDALNPGAIRYDPGSGTATELSNWSASTAVDGDGQDQSIARVEISATPSGEVVPLDHRFFIASAAWQGTKLAAPVLDID